MAFTNPVITVETVDYTGQITKAELVPDVPVQVTKTLDPDTIIVDVDTASWVWNVTILQGSVFDELLLTSAPGTELDVVFQKEPGVGKRVATFTVAAMPTNFGGERGGTLTTDMALQVVDTVAWSVSS